MKASRIYALGLLLVVSAASLHAQPSEAEVLTAIKEGNLKTLAQFLDAGYSVNGTYGTPQTTLLHHALVKQQRPLVIWLLEVGADPNTPTGDELPLMAAARLGDANMVAYLLTQKADPDSQNRHHHTALMAAARHGHATCVDLLLKAGADPTTRDADGRSARDYALEHGHAALAEQL